MSFTSNRHFEGKTPSSMNPEISLRWIANAPRLLLYSSLFVSTDFGVCLRKGDGFGRADGGSGLDMASPKRWRPALAELRHSDLCCGHAEWLGEGGRIGPLSSGARGGISFGMKGMKE